MNKEQLENIKIHAKAISEIKPILTDMAPLIISHPFTNSGFALIPQNNGEPIMLDITASEENFLLWQKEVSKQIEQAKNLEQIYTMINTPYLLYFLTCIKQHLPEKEFCKLLTYAWISTDFPSSNPNCSKQEVLEMFSEANKKFLMSEDEFNIYNNMEEEITIYRGVSKGIKKEILGLSWSLSPTIAKKFSTRFSNSGSVFKAKINKKDILAFYNSRLEAEVVVNPKHLKNIEHYKDIEEEMGDE